MNSIVIKKIDMMIEKVCSVTGNEAVVQSEHQISLRLTKMILMAFLAAAFLLLIPPAKAARNCSYTVSPQSVALSPAAAGSAGGQL